MFRVDGIPLEKVVWFGILEGVSLYSNILFSLVVLKRYEGNINIIHVYILLLNV